MLFGNQIKFHQTILLPGPSALDNKEFFSYPSLIFKPLYQGYLIIEAERLTIEVFSPEYQQASSNNHQRQNQLAYHKYSTSLPQYHDDYKMKKMVSPRPRYQTKTNMPPIAQFLTNKRPNLFTQCQYIFLAPWVPCFFKIPETSSSNTVAMNPLYPQRTFKRDNVPDMISNEGLVPTTERFQPQTSLFLRHTHLSMPLPFRRIHPFPNKTSDEFLNSFSNWNKQNENKTLINLQRHLNRCRKLNSPSVIQPLILTRINFISHFLNQRPTIIHPQPGWI